MNNTMPSNQRPVAQIPNEIASKIKAKFLEFSSSYKVPGVSFALILDNELTYSDAIGYSKVTPALKAHPEHLYRIASMTKSFTASCILILRDKGYLSLDDPIVKWLPQAKHLKYPTLDSPDITIRSLLTMSSGLVEDDPWADRQLNIDVQAFDKILESPVVFDHVSGVEYEYSNLGYALLGQVVSKVTGKSLRRFSEEELLSPLSLSSTIWDIQETPPDLQALGYSVSNNDWVHEPALGDGIFGAMGGLSSTVLDLSKYILFHLDAWPARNDADNKVLKRSSRREMAQIHRVITKPKEDHPSITLQGYGYGLVVSHHKYLGPIVGHSGGVPGFTSRMEWLPTFGAGIVTLCNRTYVPIEKVAREVLELLYQEQLISESKKEPSKALVEFQTIILKLYERFDQELLDSSACDTYFLDQDDERRPPNFSELRKKHGPLISYSPMVPTGYLRGSWKMQCQGGELEVSVMLSPTLPSKIQFIKVVSRSR